MSKLAKFYDIIIVGGGLVGKAMAAAAGLSHTLQTKKVLVLESGKPFRSTDSPRKFSNRVSSVSPSSVHFFQEIGAWNLIAKSRTQEVNALYVEDGSSSSHVLFKPIIGANPISFIVENDVILSALYKILDGLAVETLYNVKIMDCRIPDNLSENVKITLDDGFMLESSLII